MHRIFYLKFKKVHSFITFLVPTSIILRQLIVNIAKYRPVTSSFTHIILLSVLKKSFPIPTHRLFSYFNIILSFS